MHSTLGNQQNLSLPAFFFIIIAFAASAFYVYNVIRSNQKPYLNRWPIKRLFFWFAGITSSCIALIGPIANASHHDFRYHMIGHLLLGMLAPLLIALSAPITLLLRTVKKNRAKQCTRILKSKLAKFYVHPITAASLNIGGLWLLYTTPLYEKMHMFPSLFILIHMHIFAAGYLFTISIIYIDPISHRFSYVYRTLVFVIALAAHGILSKYIYAYPPNGIPAHQAQAGSMIMYYGGDLVDLILIIILFKHWYHSARPRQLQTEKAYLTAD